MTEWLMESKIEDVCVEFDAIWRHSLDGLPVARDLIRMCNFFKLYEQTGDKTQEIKFTPSLDKEVKTSTVVVDLLNAIQQKLLKLTKTEKKTDNSLVEISKEQFEKETLDSQHETVTTFLKTHLGDKHLVSKILKLCNQAVAVSFLGYVAVVCHNGMNPPVRCKDCRGTWSISLKRIENGSRDPYISVIHTRTEQAMIVLNNNTQFKNIFKFSWQVEIAFDSVKLNHIHSVEAKLLNIDWSTFDAELKEKWSPEEQQRIETTFRKIFGNPKKYDLKLHLETNALKRKSKQAKKQLNEQKKDSQKSMWFVSSSIDSFEAFEEFLTRR